MSYKFIFFPWLRNLFTKKQKTVKMGAKSLYKSEVGPWSNPYKILEFDKIVTYKQTRIGMTRFVANTKLVGKVYKLVCVTNPKIKIDDGKNLHHCLLNFNLAVDKWLYGDDR